MLLGMGLETFLPQYVSIRRWSDRVKRLEVPLFPGYLFCRFDERNRLPVLTIPGVVHIVSVNRVPAPIDDGEIAAIQTAVRSGLPLSPHGFLKTGEPVRVVDGPLRGVEGILTGEAANHLMVISISLLQRSVAISVQPEWLVPASAPMGRRLFLPPGSSPVSHRAAAAARF